MTMHVHLGHDYDIESPAEYDGWSLYSFSTNHINFKHPDEIDEDGELRAKLDNGLAFFLSYYEHGQCLWSLEGEGPQCRWDSVGHAGIMVWEQDEDNMGAKTVEDRRKDAERFLESWNAYVNGRAYFYTIYDSCDSCDGIGDVVESCAGFLGDSSVDHMFDEIRSFVGESPVKFKGDASYLADYHWDS